jgi:hypothetical protein
METIIKINKSSVIDENVILKIYYEHPKITLSIELPKHNVKQSEEPNEEPQENFNESSSYYYEGTLESLLKSNSVPDSISVEYLISSINYIFLSSKYPKDTYNFY